MLKTKQNKKNNKKNLKKKPNKLYKIYVIVVAYYYESQYINHLLREKKNSHPHTHTNTLNIHQNNLMREKLKK